VNIYLIRQFVGERLRNASDQLPNGLEPRLAPISTGLGEIYYYTVRYKDGAEGVPPTSFERLLNLNLIQDYTIKPLLRSTSGVSEINTSGGYEKQVVIVPDIQKLSSLGLTLDDLTSVLSESVENVGGGLVEIGAEQVVIRAATRVQNTQ